MGVGPPLSYPLPYTGRVNIRLKMFVGRDRGGEAPRIKIQAPEKFQMPKLPRRAGRCRILVRWAGLPGLRVFGDVWGYLQLFAANGMGRGAPRRGGSENAMMEDGGWRMAGNVVQGAVRTWVTLGGRVSLRLVLWTQPALREEKRTRRCSQRWRAAVGNAPTATMYYLPAFSQFHAAPDQLHPLGSSVETIICRDTNRTPIGYRTLLRLVLWTQPRANGGDFPIIGKSGGDWTSRSYGWILR